MLETVLTSLLDQFKWLRKYKTKVILVLCVGLFLLGLPLCCDVSISVLKKIQLSYLMIFVGGFARFFSSLLKTTEITSHENQRQFSSGETVVLLGI